MDRFATDEPKKENRPDVARLLASEWSKIRIAGPSPEGDAASILAECLSNRCQSNRHRAQTADEIRRRIRAASRIIDPPGDDGSKEGTSAETQSEKRPSLSRREGRGLDKVRSIPRKRSSGVG